MIKNVLLKLNQNQIKKKALNTIHPLIMNPMLLKMNEQGKIKDVKSGSSAEGSIDSMCQTFCVSL